MRIRGLFLLLLAACADSSPETVSARYQSTPSQSLWRLHATTASPLELDFIEAELGARGETRFGATYLGRQTANAYGRSLYQRPQTATADKDCRDFASSAEAQKYFLATGGPINDRHGLDRDGDGFACEWGRTIRQVANTQHRPVYQPPIRTIRTGPRCYVGPRGGTYTLTASGRKNYGGC